MDRQLHPYQTVGSNYPCHNSKAEIGSWMNNYITMCHVHVITYQCPSLSYSMLVKAPQAGICCIFHKTCTWLCFALFCYQFLWVHVILLPIFLRVTSLALGQSGLSCPSASEVMLNDISETDLNPTTAKHNKVQINCFISNYVLQVFQLKYQNVSVSSMCDQC